MFGLSYKESLMKGSDSRISFWENTAEEGIEEDKEHKENRFSVTQEKMHRCAS